MVLGPLFKVSVSSLGSNSCNSWWMCMKCELVLNVPADLFWFDVTFFVCSRVFTFIYVFQAK